MSPRLSGRVRSIGPSATSRAVNTSVASSFDELPIDLGAGCPDWAPPPGAIAAAIRSLKTSVGYGRPGGDPELLNVVLTAHLGSEPRARAAGVATCGGKEALFLALGAVVDPGDVVVVPAPCWPSFIDQVRAFGGVPRVVPAGPDGRPVAERLAEAIDGAKVIIANTPGNPSGVAWSSEAAEVVRSAAIRHDTWILVDSVYGRLSYGSPGTPGEWFWTQCPEHTLVVDGASKRLALPGLRLGWAVGAPVWVDAIRRLQDASTTHPSLPAQAAALAGLKAEVEWLAGVRRQLRLRAEALVEAVDGTLHLSVTPPTGGLFALVRLPANVDDVEFARRLVEHRALKVVPGSIFHCPHTLRIALRAPEDTLRSAVRRIDEELNGMST